MTSEQRHVVRLLVDREVRRRVVRLDSVGRLINKPMHEMGRWEGPSDAVRDEPGSWARWNPVRVGL
jgi:hypothetical protein